MTDEERHRLCDALRNTHPSRIMCREAANEIERLAALVQSDAEPVAWQVRAKGSFDWYVSQRESKPDIDPEFYEARPLYAAPPRSDASAGMSWSGFNVYGDKKSIDAVRDALHAKDRCEALDKMIGEKQLVRPDASAGLIEAAEWHEELAKEKLEQAKQAPEVKKRRFLDISFFHDECASALRARAADRSRK